MLPILSRYIIREHIGPFFFAFFVINLIFILNLLFRELGKFLSKGLSISVILEYLFLSLAWMIALAVPMAVLTATLMAFGRLSADYEITAIKASGISLYQILPPVLIVSTLLALSLIWFNNHILPDFNHRLRLLASDIARKKPMINLESGVLYQDIPNYNLLVQKIKEKNSISYVQDLIIDDQTDPNVIKTITAERGKIRLHQDTGLLEITLFEGEMQEVNVDEPESFRKLEFTEYVLRIPMSEVILRRSHSEYRGDREKSADALLADVQENHKRIKEIEKRINKKIKNCMLKYNLLPSKVDTTTTTNFIAKDELKHKIRPFLRYDKNKQSKQYIKSSSPTQKFFKRILRSHQQILLQIKLEQNKIKSYRRTNNIYMVEVHKKYSIPTACIVFVLIGVPLGIMARQGGMAAGGISFLFFLLYWACLIGGEILADRQKISPFLAMWTPNILVGIGGIILVIRSIHETTFIRWESFLRLFKISTKAKR